jgi:hypothetical protein
MPQATVRVPSIFSLVLPTGTPRRPSRAMSKTPIILHMSQVGSFVLLGRKVKADRDASHCDPSIWVSASADREWTTGMTAEPLGA